MSKKKIGGVVLVLLVIVGFWYFKKDTVSIGRSGSIEYEAKFWNGFNDRHK